MPELKRWEVAHGKEKQVNHRHSRAQPDSRGTLSPGHVVLEESGDTPGKMHFGGTWVAQQLGICLQLRA